MNKVCTRWIPRILTEENKRNKFPASSNMLHQYHMEEDQFLDRIVTTYEAMIYLFI